MNRLGNILRAWLPLAVVVTSFSLLAYVMVQQSLRQGANDPQIQMAQDAAMALNGGASTDSVVPQDRVEFSRSLAPFLMIFDANGDPVASSGVLQGKMPEYPKGALEAAKQEGENRVTWQPTSDVRVASVVVPYQGGYVVAGRNLREVEQREAQTSSFAAGTWLVTLVVVLAVIAVVHKG